MIALGYMAKRIVSRPEWLDVPHVSDIYAVSSCISGDFCDYVNFWKHNGYWFFNSPKDINQIAASHDIDMEGTELLYYSGHHLQFDADAKSWKPFEPNDAFPTNVSPPKQPRLLGFDVVTYSMQNMPECSPLSCNRIAADLFVNEHCLIEQLDHALDWLESGLFNDCEPGPYRVVAVNSVNPANET